MADVRYVTVALSDGVSVQVVEGTPLHDWYLALAARTSTVTSSSPDIDLSTLRPMAWFMTPHGPQSVIEPATIAEFRRRDYAEITAQQAADFFAGAVEIPDVSFITGQELPAAMAAAAADDDSPFAVAQRAAFGARVAPALAGVDFALRNSLSTAIGWHGDSTSDSDGSDPADLRTPIRLAERIADAYPNFHVIARTWEPVAQTFAAPVVLQAATGGQEYANFTVRSVRYPSAPFTSGDLDLRTHVDGGLTANDQALIVQMVGDGVTYGTGMVFRWVIRPTGALRLAVSYDGTGLDNFESTVPLPSTFTGWLRATCEITADATNGSIEVNFYTSADGETWTLLGAPNGPYLGPRSTLHSTTATHFEVGAEGWQPAASSFVGKVYEVQVRDGIDGPLLAPARPRLWERYPDPSTTYGGAPTLYLINASRSGADLAYHTDPARLKKMTPDYGQATVYFNVSHNMVGVSGPVDWLEPYRQWVEAVQTRLPAAAAVAVGQNPHTSAWANEENYGVSHVKRIAELATYAGRQGWGFLDLFGAFNTDPRGLGVLVSDDGLHPSQAGYALGGDTAAKQLGIS